MIISLRTNLLKSVEVDQEIVHQKKENKIIDAFQKVSENGFQCSFLYLLTQLLTAFMN